VAVNLITYDALRHKIARPVTSREEYISLRDSEQNRVADKKHLVQMNYSLVSPQNVEILEFPLRGAKTVGNSVGMDIDWTPSPLPRGGEEPADASKEEWMKKVPEMILAKKDEIGLLMLERSATKGFHIVFRRRPEMSQEENLRWASDMLGVEFDKGAKDVTRVFFTPTSEKLLFLSDEIFCQEALKERNNIVQDEPPVSEDATARESAVDATDSHTEYGAMSPIQDLNYLGIPYSQIIDKYWELFYQGQTPVKSNRDTLTYELANVMKHICGFDRGVLARVIPCYDGFPEVEKMKCIDSALSGKRTQMPKRLREVLLSLRQDQLRNSSDPNSPLWEMERAAFDEVLGQDELFYYNKIPKAMMVQGVKDSIDAAGHSLAMPTITAVCPAIGARATGVQLVVHGKPNTLNLISYIAGDFASGKGQMDDIVKAWMAEDVMMAEMYNQQWAEYAEKKKQSKNKKEQPVEPKFPKVWLTLNNTTANLAEELANVQGRHAFSFTPEADVVSQKWKTSISDFSTMIRQSYDGSSYDREARSVDAVNVHIPRLLWNVVMCGTPDALYRVVNNYTDGFQSRIAVARTPDNTFAPLADNPAHLTDRQKEKIEQISHLLPLMNGIVELPKLEARGREWLEEIRLETMKNDDKVMARQRMRICVTAQRMTCCLMLVAVCAKLIKEHGVAGAEKRLKTDPYMWQKMIEKMQTQAFMDMFGIVADSLIDNAMFFFRDRIEDAFSARTYAGSTKASAGRSRKGKNDSIYSRLPQEFSFGEAMSHSVAVKGATVTQNAVQQMLKNWMKQGLAEVLENGNYRKVNNV